MTDFSLIGGVGIMGFISPKDTNDTYAVIDPLYGIDGLRNVSSQIELDTITPERRRTGMVVGISGTTYYKLKPEPWTYTFSDWELFFVGITGGTFNNYTLTLNSNDGNSIVITGLTDYYTTGATYDNNTKLITFERNDGTNGYTVDLSSLDTNDTFVTGTTWDSNYNRLELYRNDGVSFGSDINSFSNLTINNILSATTIESDSIKTNNFQLISSGNTSGNLLSSDYNGNSSWISEQDLTLWSLVVTGNKLLSGGASYVSGLTFSITPLRYIINGVIYEIPTSSFVTLNTGDVFYDRIDVIVADISGNTSVVEGIPSANPEKPDIDESTQVEVTFVSIPANSSTPDISLLLIYDENTGYPTEWLFSTNNPTRIKSDSTNQSYSGTKSIEVSGVTLTTSYLNLTPSSQIDTSQYSTIQFAIKNRIANNTTNQLRFSFLNVGGVQIGNVVIMNAANTAGYIQYSSSNTSTWQLISIPLWKFGLTNTIVNSLRVQFVNTSTNQSNLFLDKIQLVEGIVDAPPTNSWLNMKGDTTTIITAPSPNATLTISGGNNLNSRALTTSVILDLDNYISLSGITVNNINVSGYTTTNNLRLTKSPTTGYALISSDNLGNANWSPLTISAVTSLQSSLDGKTNLTLFNQHTGDTNNPHQTTFFNLVSTAHTHTINDVINLQSSLDGKFDKIGGIVNGDVIINGNVNILGTATTINTQTLSVTDNVVTLNANYTAGTPFFGHSGVEVLRGSGTTAALLWEEQRNQWEAGLHGTTQKILLSGDSLSLLNSGHTHPISEVVNLQPSLDSKFDKSGGTIYGDLIITGTSSATVYYGDGSLLTGIVTDNFYVTGGTFSNDVLTLNRQDGLVSVTGFTTMWVPGSSGLYSIRAKNDSIVNATGNYAVAEGYGTIASGVASHAEGSGTTASGLFSHSEGWNTIASGDYNHAEGYSTLASGTFGSHAEGAGTTSAGQSSHSEGGNTRALGNQSHAEGGNTSAAGQISHAEGFLTLASGAYSHSEGLRTTSSGQPSHAEGEFTTASGNRSHSEGYYTTASGFGSHSEGQLTVASGDYSHTEGVSTIASGVGSHSEGSGTTASGISSHAGGNGSKATGLNSFVHGNGSIATGVTTIVFGDNIIGTDGNTVYVPNLNIGIIGVGNSIKNLGVDISGNVVSGVSVNTFITGFTYSNNTIDISQNDGLTPLSVTINSMTGLTIDGGLTVSGTSNFNEIFTNSISATTITTPSVLSTTIYTTIVSATTIYIEGTELSTAASDLFNYYNSI